MTRLCDLALKHGTDKCPSWNGNTGHSYTPYYDELLRGRMIRTVFEIGICTGASLRMWQDYFPDARIFGIDSVPWVLIEAGRIKSFQCDQSDEKALREVALKIGEPFDLIIDDGSHIEDHQVISANALIPFLSAAGLYVIEDVQLGTAENIQRRLNYPSRVVHPTSALAPHRSDDTLIIVEKSNG